MRGSSWVAVRILPSVHTNPVFVEVGGQRIRHRRSEEWLRKAVDVCWSQKERRIRKEENKQPERRMIVPPRTTIRRSETALRSDIRRRSPKKAQATDDALLDN